jgi:hypothetical protein
VRLFLLHEKELGIRSLEFASCRGGSAYPPEKAIENAIENAVENAIGQIR